MRQLHLQGFTLIELLVAMVVIAILAAVAIPNYTDYVRRNNRVAAQAFISEVASRQQQYLLNRRTYGSLADLGITVPADVARSYTVTVPTATAAAFVVQAAPVGGQTADACGTLNVDQNGTRSASTGAPRCW